MRLNLGKSLLSFMLVTLLASFGFAQTVVTGAVYDADYAPIAGAEAEVSGTGQKVSTDEQGVFTLTVEPGKGMIEVTSDEKGTQNVPYTVAEGETADLGMVILEGGDGVSLEGIVVMGKGIIDIAEDRKTPIAVSTIRKEEILDKAVGNVEFPEAMKNTPNVFVTNQSGGYGDGQMFLRGFSQSNTAFLLNGQPINGMEDGKMYWSNWSGLSDIANAVQIQRGLGSSKLAISSVGGTINIVTKATEKKQGGFARFLTGSGSYFKGTMGYNTGVSDKGWAFSVMLDYWQGWRSWADGTQGQGQSYFISVGKKLGNHNLNFLLTGAPQWHNQNYSKSLESYETYGKRYNNNWGWLDGETFTWRKNYYHKPIANLNWDWTINDKLNLSTVLYGSLGRGGGTGPYGSRNQYNIVDSSNGLIDFDQIVENNEAITGGIGTYGTAAARRASVNNHLWYGGVTNLSFDTKNNFTFNVGADVRFYTGDHFRQLNKLLGLQGWDDAYGRYGSPSSYIVTETYDANPWAALFNFADEEDRIAYDYTEWINYQGVFGQVEYANDRFSAFAQGAISNQSYQKEDRFIFGGEKSEKLKKTGYNLKGGFSVNLDENNIVFANAGFYSRQPFFDSVFSYNSITPNDPEVDNEEITGIEAGYKTTIGKVNLNINLYYTKWANRFISSDGDYTDPVTLVYYSDVTTQFSNIGQVHKGFEIDFNSKLASFATLRGYFTYGDWEYDGSTPYKIYDTSNGQTLIASGETDLSGVYVGSAPQVTFGLGTALDITKKLSFDTDFNFYGKLYADTDPEDIAQASRNNTTYQSDKLNDYVVVDTGLSYKFSKDFKLRGNIYNLFNDLYISRKNSYGYYYGRGRTYNVSLTYNF